MFGDYINYLLIYFVFINNLTFLLFFVDKQKAIKGKYRISEKTLLILSFLGGSVAAIFAMRLIRHKNKKFSFLFKYIMIVVVQIALLYLYIKYIA